MGIHARIEPGGYITIDTAAWITERTGGPDPDLTDDLRCWADQRAMNGKHLNQDPDLDWVSVARAWAAERGHELRDPDVIAHDEHTRLDTPIWIVRAVVESHYTIAVIGVDTAPGTVYADTCTDSGYWFDADAVDIVCPSGHGWTWRAGGELVTSQGDFTTIARVFGTGLDAPFSPCLDCEATAWIICPRCGQRCDVELPTQ